MTAPALVGSLLGAVSALPTAWLAELTAHDRLNRPLQLRLVLMTAAAVFGAVAAGHRGLPTAAVALLTLIPAAAGAIVDIHERRLPDHLTAAVAVVVALEVAVLLVIDPAAGKRGAFAFVLGGVTAVVTKAVFTDAVGWGDVKLAPNLAAFLAIHGWLTLYGGVLAWSILVALTAVVSLAYPSRTGIVAFGPALVVGSAAILAVG